MKILTTTCKYKAEVMVDDDVYLWASKVKWVASKSLNEFTGAKLNPYIRRNTGHYKAKRTEYLHIRIMQPPAGMQVDHIDHNVWNCQRSNLRVCTKKQNARNKSKATNCSSQYKGVYLHQGKWRARIKSEGLPIHGKELGSFKTELEAAQAYNLAAVQYHGEFANLNKL